MPPAFWIIVIKTVIMVINDKHTKVKESMRMMGMLDSAYYTSIFLTEGVLIGTLTSIFCSIFSLYENVLYPELKFFNGAAYGDCFALFFCYCLSAVPFALFICSFFDTPGAASQSTLAALMGFYALFAGILTTNDNIADLQWACIIPPIAIQIGCNSLSYPDNPAYPSVSTICGILIGDTFLYVAMAWYFSQVIPSSVGVHKHPLFLFDKTYWFGSTQQGENMRGESQSPLAIPMNSPKSPTNGAKISPHLNANGEEIPIESVDEKFLGKPTVVLKGLTKTFGSQVAVNNLSFSMYENQIFALLGHNGAGKTTTINMLTGSIPCDNTGMDTGAWIHGISIHDGMDEIRKTMGVCPQHDVLFDNVTVLDHILFFAQLKGQSYQESLEEASKLIKLFHLEKRTHHLGHELSGGQRRKLSVAIAICGGSKFIILDEPTAGMDPLARRELWDLLAELRHGRTMLLTTHYMDECNVLGDRTAIINLGGLACLGSNPFLKTTFGTGYRLICDAALDQSKQQENDLQKFVLNNISGSTRAIKDEEKRNSTASRLSSAKKSFSESQKSEIGQKDDVESAQKVLSDVSKTVEFTLPFDSVSQFGNFFKSFGTPAELHKKFGITDFGVNISSLEDVFLSVGGDESVQPTLLEDQGNGIGSSQKFQPTFIRQTLAICYRRLMYAASDFITIPTLLLPLGGVIGGALLFKSNLIIVPGKDLEALNTVVISFFIGGIYYASFLTVPGLLCEFLIKERESRLRNVLTIMGCDFRAFWLGNFIADFSLLSLPLIAMFISWGAADMTSFYKENNGAAFWLLILFNAQLIAFSYIWSFFFTSSKAAAAAMPLIIIGLFILPAIVILLGLLIYVQVLQYSVGGNFNVFGYLFYGIALCSPHGGMLIGIMVRKYVGYV